MTKLEEVQSLYEKLNNKQLFIAIFTTTRFWNVSEDMLDSMLKFLKSKVNEN